MSSKLKSLFGMHPTRDYSDLELHLEDMLQPVKPRADYITELKNKLQLQLSAIPAIPSFSSSQGVLLFIAGIFSGVLVMAVSVRLAITFVAALSVLQHYRKRQTTGRFPRVM